MDLRDCPCTASDGLSAALAVPDAHRVSLDRVLAAERADVAGVLGDFHLLHLLSEGGTVSVDSVSACRSLSSRLQCVSFGWARSVEGIFGIAYLVPYLPVTPTSGIVSAQRPRSLSYRAAYSLCASSFWRW